MKSQLESVSRRRNVEVYLITHLEGGTDDGSLIVMCVDNQHAESWAILQIMISFLYVG